VGPSPASGERPPRKVGRVEWCYVEKEARGIGIGTALLEGLITWMVEQSCTDVDALAVPGDRLTKQLLEAAGLKARLLVLHRKLDHH
jgi:GNAT superfamily N-acetyltransferase